MTTTTLFDIFSDSTNHITVDVGHFTYSARLEGEEIVLRDNKDEDCPFRINVRTLKITPTIVKRFPSSYIQPKDFFGLPSNRNSIRFFIQSDTNPKGVVEGVYLLYSYNSEMNALTFQTWLSNVFIRIYHDISYVVIYTPETNKIIVTSLATIWNNNMVETAGTYEDAQRYIERIERVIQHSAMR